MVKTMTQYRTKENDMIDAICYRYYGEQSGVVEQVFAANQNLSRLPEQLPAGLFIELPPLINPSKDCTPLRLWQ